MERKFSELLASLFKTGASVEYDKLQKAVIRKNEDLVSRGLFESTIRAQVVTQMVIDCYEAVLLYVVKQLDIPADAVDIRTQDDADLCLRRFDSEAEAVRCRLQLKRNRMIANVPANWQGGDEYERKTLNLKERAVASLHMQVSATLNPDAKAREETWKRVRQVVGAQVIARAREIEEKTRASVYALGKRRPPAGEAYDSEHIAGMWVKGLMERVDLVFSLYPEVVNQLRVSPDGLHSLIRTHVTTLVDEAVADYRRIVAQEFEEWGHEVPQAVVERAVTAARSAAIAETELMLVALEKRPPPQQEERLGEGQVARDKQLRTVAPPTIDVPSPTVLGSKVGRHVPAINGVHEYGALIPDSTTPVPERPKPDKSVGHQILVGVVVGLVIAVAAVGGYWFQKTRIDRAEEDRKLRRDDRRELMRTVGPIIESCNTTLGAAVLLLQEPGKAAMQPAEFERSCHLDSLATSLMHERVRQLFPPEVAANYGYYIGNLTKIVERLPGVSRKDLEESKQTGQPLLITLLKFQDP